ncbi:MAG: 3'-5' exonuclease [Chlamydiota bacterium]|nr:3'-5' exonuclease [Chlamydiota bacterium]
MDHYPANSEIVVLDFETTGLSTSEHRIIEVGAAIVERNTIKSTFSSLCNPGTKIPPFITSLTGITNAMVSSQPTPEEVMEEFSCFVGNRPIIAHNASFDGRFLSAEMARIGKGVANPIACTMLLSRRLITDSSDYKLGTLKEYVGFQADDHHKDHRALDDVKVTVALWNYLLRVLEGTVGHDAITFAEVQKISRISKYKIKDFLCQLSQPSV